MGRVEEAMRRAAEAGQSGSSDAVLDSSRAASPGGRRPTSAAEVAGFRPLADADLRGTTATVEPADAAELRRDPERSDDAPALRERMNPLLKGKVVIDPMMDAGSREQYRRLAASLYHLQADSGHKVLMVASARPSEGKSLTAVNLGLTLSESYRRNVLIIDADLRRPSLHEAFQVEGTPGLTEGLVAGEDWKMPLHRLSPRLTLLTAGTPSSDPMFGLTSARMRRLIEDAREAFTWVIVDTPPIGLLTDANLLAAMVDGAVLVIKAGETPHDQVRRAIEALGPSKLLGVVLNRAVTQIGGKYGYDYTRYYAAPAQS